MGFVWLCGSHSCLTNMSEFMPYRNDSYFKSKQRYYGICRRKLKQYLNFWSRALTPEQRLWLVWLSSLRKSTKNGIKYLSKGTKLSEPHPASHGQETLGNISRMMHTCPANPTIVVRGWANTTIHIWGKIHLTSFLSSPASEQFRQMAKAEDSRPQVHPSHSYLPDESEIRSVHFHPLTPQVGWHHMGAHILSE